MAQFDDVKDNKVKTASGTEAGFAVGNAAKDAVADIVNVIVAGEVKKRDPDEFQLTRKKTFFVKHGAGGTHAITADVQEAIEEAYTQGLKKLNGELKI